MNQIANPDGATAQTQAVIGAILALLHERTGCDFSRYRTATVYRRILNRMISLGIDTFGEYLKLLEAAEDETLRLLERVTIKVSRFYRNCATFDLLRRRVIPDLARARRGRPVRVWSAGCGCGEEAYTLAMLLDEAGGAGFVEASDIDPAALEAARTGVYRPEALSELPADLIDRYLEPVRLRNRECHRIRDSLRRRVRVSRHDLTAQKPVPGQEAFDLVCCRNVLIYLQRDVQEQTLQRIRRAVDRGGFLCLGEAEWLAKPVAASLEVFGRKTHIFRAVESFSSGGTR